MTTSLVDAQSVLALDIGTVNTRALLFDVVAGQYHLIASTSVPSTVYAPYGDATEGVHQAVTRMETITGRVLLDSSTFLIVPSRADNSGVDQVIVTVSAGPDLRMVTAGLLPDVSLESAQKLAAASYGQVVDSIGLNDRRRTEAQLDAILRAQPDLVIIAGGTDNGATRSVLKMVDLIALVCRLLPHARRPEVVFAGNPALEKRVQDTFNGLAALHCAPNLRPGIDVEDLRPAQDVLAHATGKIRLRQIGGLQRLSSLTGSDPVPTAYAFGQVMRFLSRIYANNKCVLGVDVGGSATVLAAAVGGRLAMHVQRPAGMSAGLNQLLEQGRIEDIIQWLPMHVTDESVRDYLWNKTLFPSSLPLTSETLAIEQAAARQLLHVGMQQLATRWSSLPPIFEPIIASGAVFAQAATPGQALLMLLDGLQPQGITTIYLDQFNLVPALGAIAPYNNLLPVQVIETGALLNLGTVISPVSSARYNTPILRASLDFGDGNITKTEIRQGTLTVLPIQPGQTARLDLEPLRKFELDPRRKDGARSLKITGGACGAVIDARGRPLTLPPDAPRRREMLKKWMATL